MSIFDLPFVWCMFMLSVFLMGFSLAIGLLSIIVDWLFKPKNIFFHIVANTLELIGTALFILSNILILIDYYL